MEIGDSRFLQALTGTSTNVARRFGTGNHIRTRTRKARQPTWSQSDYAELCMGGSTPTRRSPLSWEYRCGRCRVRCRCGNRQIAVEVTRFGAGNHERTSGRRWRRKGAGGEAQRGCGAPAGAVTIASEMGRAGVAPLSIHSLKDRLLPRKYPRIVEFVANLPKTGAGKIDRRALRSAASKRADASMAR